MIHRIVALLLLMVTAGCRETALPEAAAIPGEPVPGLDAGHLARFEAGQTLFDRDFTEAEGLGPLFNQRRCSSCHDIPTPGGNGSELITKMTRFEAPDRCDLLESEGGDMLQAQVTTPLERLGFRRERPSPHATAVIDIHAPPLYGLGLMEAVPEEDIVARADPDDADGDGISGRIVRLEDGRLGRFGRKLRFASIRDFTEDALRDELGITSPGRPDESTLSGQPLPPDVDPAPDPEVDDVLVDRLADYVRLLAAPAREVPGSSAAADSIAAGRSLFERAGCDACHTPEVTTASTDFPALHGRRVQLYSDLLLHDLGDEMASICGPDASPSEWRTAPLLGLRHRSALLHDGRTQALRAAIEAHGGEAASSRSRFRSFTEEQKAMLVRFLGSL